MHVRSQLQRMIGRDPAEEGRAGSTLEIFYDLVFVVAFSVASTQLAHYLADGHYGTAVLGYLFMTFAAIWAWLSFAWFASAFDTDDWLFRLLVLIQMIGVAIIAIGIPEVFSSIDAGEHPAMTVPVIGYIVMRVGMVAQWLRAAASSPELRRTCLTYAGTLLIAQVGWLIVAISPLNLRDTLLAVAVLVAIEFFAPWYAESRVAATPWNPSHIAERYATLTVVTLGEGVVGTVALLQALIERTGWGMQTGVLGLAAMGVTFAMWWLYFAMPGGETLRERPERAFIFGYGSIPLLMACAAVGAGLHVVALWTEHESHISEFAIVVCLAVPVAVFSLGVIVLNAILTRGESGESPENAEADPVPVTAALAAALLPLVVALVLAAFGVPLMVCVVIVCLIPVLPVVIIETVGD